MLEPRPLLRAAGAAFAAAVLLAGCATVSGVDRARFESDGTIVAVPLDCGAREPLARTNGSLAPDRPLAIVSWNIHKNGDPGWQADLARWAAGSDVVLLQEASLDADLVSILDGSGQVWLHADAWALDGVPKGVLTASRVAPREACVQRAREPLIGLPKSALVTWYRIGGRTDMLAIANLHAINFTLDLRAWHEQLGALEALIAAHPGPAILAGDFNTWNEARRDALSALAARLHLKEATPSRGVRTRFAGLFVDYLFVRGLDVEDAWVEPTDSSDHAPVRAVLRFAPP